ncbi:MAG: hypothetical protein WAU68_15610 [Vitreimonas sp.]
MSGEVIEIGDAQKRFVLAWDAYELASSCICAANNVTFDVGAVEVQIRYRRIVQEQFPRLFQDHWDRESSEDDIAAHRRQMNELESEVTLLLTTFIERKIAELYRGAT